MRIPQLRPASGSRFLRNQVSRAGTGRKSTYGFKYDLDSQFRHPLESDTSGNGQHALACRSALGTLWILRMDGSRWDRWPHRWAGPAGWTGNQWIPMDSAGCPLPSSVMMAKGTLQESMDSYGFPMDFQRESKENGLPARSGYPLRARSLVSGRRSRNLEIPEHRATPCYRSGPGRDPICSTV